MMNWSCQGVRWSSVWVATRLAHSAPIVGPRAQKPIATPRPICGEKSRISAGVETRMTPSTNPITQYDAANQNFSVMWGMAKSWISATTSVP